MNLCDKKICSILDAQRTQVYMGQYKFENNRLVELKNVDVIEIDDLIAVSYTHLDVYKRQR